MESFRNNISSFNRVLISLFLVAFFLDGADTLDIFTGSTIVVHSVEDFSFEQSRQEISQGARPESYKARKITFAAHEKHKKSGTKPLRIILDEDSASLAATEIESGIDVLPFTPEQTSLLYSVFRSSPLFLKYCTLLI